MNEKSETIVAMPLPEPRANGAGIQRPALHHQQLCLPSIVQLPFGIQLWSRVPLSNKVEQLACQDFLQTMSGSTIVEGSKRKLK